MALSDPVDPTDKTPLTLTGATEVGDHVHIADTASCGHSLLVNERETPEVSAMRLGRGFKISGEEGEERTIRVGSEIITIDGDDVVKDVITLRGHSGPSRANSRAYRNNYDSIFGKKGDN